MQDLRTQLEGQQATTNALHSSLEHTTKALMADVAASITATQAEAKLASDVADSKLRELEAGIAASMLKAEQQAEEAGAELKAVLEGELAKCATREDVEAMREDLERVQNETRAIQEQGALDMQGTHELMAAMEEQAQAQRYALYINAHLFRIYK